LVDKLKLRNTALSDQTGTLTHSASCSKDTGVLFTNMEVGKIGRKGGIHPLFPITFSWRVPEQIHTLKYSEGFQN